MLNDPYGLIAVDVQIDFLPGGVLGVPDGDQILMPLARYARHAQIVIASRDWHPADHFSFAKDPQYVEGSWPSHCVQGTNGARIHPSIAEHADCIVSKAMNRDSPDEYSAFVAKSQRPNPTLEEIIKTSPVDTLVIGGLVLEYCVKATALDAIRLGYKTIVPLELTRSLSTEDGAVAVQTLEHAGVIVTDTVSGSN